MRASIIAVALLGALGLAAPVSAAGFGTPQTGAATGIGSIGVIVGQIPVTSASFALVGCDVDNLEGPAVSSAGPASRSATDRCSLWMTPKGCPVPSSSRNCCAPGSSSTTSAWSLSAPGT
jgi:hypothetical protein